jgi:hypothetical protein
VERLFESFLKLNPDMMLSEGLLREFNSMQKQQILSNYGDNFTVAFEFEIDLNPEVDGESLIKSHVNDEIFNINIPEKTMLESFSFANYDRVDLIKMINTFPDALKKINKFMFQTISNAKNLDNDTPIINLISSVDNFVDRQLMKLDSSMRRSVILMRIFKDDIKKYIETVYIPSVIEAIKKYFHITIFTSPMSFLRKIERESDIANQVLLGVIASAIKENLRHNLFKVLFPEFYEKYGAIINIKPDGTLTNYGIEVVNNPYVDGLQKGFEYIDDFYTDLKKQNVLLFGKRTGIHVNIGYKNDNPFNIIKGFLLNNEYDKDGKVGGMAYKGMGNRTTNANTLPYDDKFMMIAKEAIVGAQLSGKLPKYTKDSLPIYEKLLNQSLMVSVTRIEKSIGFNVSKIYNKYIEFRYPGGDVSAETLKEQTIYYANIVLACKDPEYRKEDYMNKLNKLVIDILSNVNAETIHKSVNNNPKDLQTKVSADQQNNKAA